MSAAACAESEPQAAPALRPVWLRPLALAAILAAHGALLFAVRANVEPPPSLESLEVSLVPLGDAPQDQMAQEEIKPQPEPPPPPPPPPQQAELTAPPPEQIAPQAPPLPVAKPKPIVKPKPKPVVEEEDDEPSPAELRRIAEKKREAAERRRKAQEARQAARRGAAEGSAQASGASRANYAGLIIAELNRHKFFPAAARAAGEGGSVGVAFTIGASGRVVSQSITSSSGNAALDGAARVIMSAIHAPPPPGGQFSTTTTIKFHLN